jgi:sec-independent protein translocase protein TatC
MTKKRTKARRTEKSRSQTDAKLPFLEHFKELKRRLTFVAVSITAIGTATYFVQQQVVEFLLRPAAGQKLIYTSPGGGLDFLFRVCIYTGIVFSIPVIVYQILKYIEPLIGNHATRFALLGSFASGILALAGMTFGYYAGLPATLHFLFHQFTTSQIHPLIAVQSYMKFITMYMFGAALLFQVPLIILFINRIKPLNPSALWRNERWMILCSFILSVLMNPTPNIIDQLMLAGPMILTYQIAIVLVWLVNRPKRSPKVRAMMARDAEIQAERQARLRDARTVWEQAQSIAEHPTTALTSLQQSIAPSIADTGMSVLATDIAASGPVRREATLATVAVPVTPTAPSSRPRKYVDGFGRRAARSVY